MIKGRVRSELMTIHLMKTIRVLPAVFVLTVCALSLPARGAKPAEAYAAGVPAPTVGGVAYGKHPRQVMDFWKASSDKPTPLVFVIHGGGWVGGSKERVNRFVDVKRVLDAGISVVAINYRLIAKGGADNEVPPVKAPLDDAARALQFVRSKAAEWNLDKSRIGAAGGSAGACSSLWLAYHDDMADASSQDPVARESTRLWCAGVVGAQTSLDPAQMKEWMPNSSYGAHAFGKKSFADFLSSRDEIRPWIQQYSPYALASKGDPPVLIQYGASPAMGQDQKDPTHSANFGVGLKKRCDDLGIRCHLLYPGAPDAGFADTTDFLIKTLSAK